jgi:Domain of unknown function (DUF222)/HNH endonuclease
MPHPIVALPLISFAPFVVRVCDSVGMDADLDDLAASVETVAARSPWALSDDELTSRIRRVHELTSRLTAVSATLVREADGRAVADRTGSPSTTVWVRQLLHVSAPEARTLLTFGKLIENRPRLADAVSCGSVNNSQALAIGKVLEDVPDDDPTTVDKVESLLVDLAKEHEPAVLRQLGERVLAHVNPELADAKLRDKLEREERHAHQRRGFTLASDGRGGTRLSGVLDPEGAAMVAAAIEPLSSPVRGESGADLRTPAARRADALVEVCRLTLRTEQLPTSGGLPAQVTVTVDHDALARDVAIGQLDTGSRLAPSAVRRLACEAGILPVVLDTAGIPIDVGRARRPYTGAVRTAVALRDGGCAFPGCDRPIRWCHVHHITPWSAGGGTDRDNGVALCGYHHRLMHHSGWQVRMGADRHPEFIPPPHLDPDQRPRRNPYHLRE